MIGRVRSHLWLLLGIALVTVASSCGKKAEPVVETTTVAPAPKGPDYQVYAPLKKATRAKTMPFLVGDEGVEEMTCFQAIEGLEYSDAGMAERKLIEDHGSELASALAAWMVSELTPIGLTEAQAARWEVTAQDAVVLEVPDERVRFVDGPECISDKTGWLPKGTRAVTGLIGAKSFSFEASIPVSKDLKEEMLRVIEGKGIKLESEALFRYEPLKNTKGELIANEQGVPMYLAPDGTQIPETEVPPESQQVMKEWSMEFEQPLYFAFHELAQDAWRREAEKDKCDVNLIWQDVKPRRPDCEEFDESAFSIVKTEDGEASITITTGEDNKGVVMGFKKAERVQLNDRIILWLSPVEIEEGALVRVNSLVLDPKPMASAPTPTAQVKDEEKPAFSPSGKTNLDDYLKN